MSTTLAEMAAGFRADARDMHGEAKRQLTAAKELKAQAEKTIVDALALEAAADQLAPRRGRPRSNGDPIVDEVVESIRATPEGQIEAEMWA